MHVLRGSVGPCAPRPKPLPALLRTEIRDRGTRSLGEGGAAQQWLTITLFLYNIGWREWNFGRAAALAWILFLIILPISLIQWRVLRRDLQY